MKKIVIALIVLVGVSSLVQAKDTSFRGSFKNMAYYYGEQESDTWVGESLLDLRFRAYFDDDRHWQLVSQLEARYNGLNLEDGWILEDQEYRPYASFSNLYLGIYYDEVDVYLGIRTVDWGITDRFTPIDLINPRDISDPVYDRNIGVPMLALNCSLYDLGVQTELIMSYFTPGRLPVQESHFFSGVDDLEIVQKMPWDNFQTAYKIQWEQDALKLVGMGFYGHDSLPFIGLDIISPTEIQVLYNYEKMWALGGGFDWSFKGLVFSGEAAYYWYPDLEDQDYGQYVLALDYNAGQVGDYTLYFNVQYIGETPVIEDLDWIRHNFTNAFSTKVMLGDEYFNTQVEGVYDMTNDNLLVIPSISYAFGDNFILGVEYNYFNGRTGSYGEFNQDNNRGIISLEMVF